MRILPLLYLCLAATCAFGTSLTFPDDLKPWVDWVKEQEPHSGCISVSDGGSSCAWGGILHLVVVDKGMTFSQEWTMFSDDWVQLPGNDEYWPQKVTSGGEDIAVTPVKEAPSVYLAKGVHRISGSLNWTSIPEAMVLPNTIALVNLTINGKRVTRPNRDKDGRLWFGLNDTSGEEMGADETSLQIFRKVTDHEPLLICSELQLSLSGKPRELLVGKFLPDHSVIMSLESPLPARIEKDGNLRIQVRPGSYKVRLTSRLVGASDTLRVSGTTDFWPPEEIWSFEANNLLRICKVGGGIQIDPSQTSLPEEWRKFPAYVLKNGSPLILTEEHRGDFAPAADELSLTRTLWLDFDGKGYTVKDELSGTISQSSRLECEHDFTPGSITMHGEPVLITTSDSITAGTEVKKGDIRMTVLGRYFKRSHHMSLSGWKHSFTYVRTTLNLPPGWRLLSAGGIEHIVGSWIDSWNLWEVFLALALMVSLVKFLGVRFGILAGVTFLLTFQEARAPVYSWAALTAACALLRVIPFVKARLPLTIVFSACFLFVAGTTCVFSIGKFRSALYPQIREQETVTSDFYEKIPEERVAKLIKADVPDGSNVSAQQSSESPQRSYAKSRMQSKDESRYDVGAKIQTGPGEPTWEWNSAVLGSEGVVDAGEKMTLLLIPPVLTRCLNFLAPLTIMLLLYGFISCFRKMHPTASGSSPRAPVKAAGLLLLTFIAFPHTAHAAFPEEEMLRELKERIARTEVCTTNCAAMNRGTISVAKNVVTMELILSAQKQTSFPLPHSENWIPAEASFDNRTIPVFSVVNTPHVLLPAGVCTIILRGTVRGNHCQITFPFMVHNLEFTADTWTAQGLSDGSLPGNSLTFDKIAEEAGSEELEKRLLPDPVPPFCMVDRSIVIDKEWYATTTVTRMAPDRGALSLVIPLIAGEAVISDKITRKNDSVIVTIPDGESMVEWTSRLERLPRFTLRAPQTTDWHEVWHLTASTTWHVTTKGIFPVKSENREWYPRPGEELEISIERPKAVDGSTRTVEHVAITQKPGKKSSEVTMKLRVKSSNGDKFPIELPQGATLEKVLIDGNETMVSQTGSNVEIPLFPGSQTITLSWKEPTGISVITRTSQPIIKDPLTNINLTMDLPYNRWTLYTAGPQLGPAVQFWGILIALVIFALILAYTRITPLAAWQWILLFIGLSTINNLGGIAIVLWFVVLTWKENNHPAVVGRWYNMLQLLLIILSVGALVSLIASVPFGLLSHPTMQINGNGSTAYNLRWFLDKSNSSTLPQGIVVSFPIWVYRLVMLSWSLWLALSLPKWLSWAWKVYCGSGFWRNAPKREVTKKGGTAE